MGFFFISCFGIVEHFVVDGGPYSAQKPLTEHSAPRDVKRIAVLSHPVAIRKHFE